MQVKTWRALAASLCLTAVAGGASASDDWDAFWNADPAVPYAEQRADGYELLSWAKFSQFDTWCDGECMGSVYAGKFVTSNMSEIFGWETFVPPWDYTYEDDYIISASFGRRFATLFDVIDLEAETGAAVRFGLETAGEFWIAAYARWTAFPWNNHIRTSFAINTGLNLATNVTDLEQRRGGTPSGSHILHYLAPELTFAHPDWKQSEVVLRFHHRSGGHNIWGDTGIFKDVSGGAQYWVLGFRQRF